MELLYAEYMGPYCGMTADLIGELESGRKSLLKPICGCGVSKDQINKI